MFKDIRFWLAFFFVIRLFGITNPPLENAHDWRQCLTNMMSRNLYEVSNNPFYPMVDNGGRHETGIVASEFPVYNYTVYAVSLLFGYQHWYGRLINLILSTLACWFFYKLLSLYFTRKIAFSATYILCISIWFIFSRKTMPDVFSVSLMLIAFYQLAIYIQSSAWWRLASFGILAALAVLTKVPVIFMFSLLGIVLVQKSISNLKKLSMMTTAIAVFSIMYWWYFVWGEYLLKTYEYQLYFPKNFKEGPKEFIETLPLALERFYFSAFQSFIAFALFIWGLGVIIPQKMKLAGAILGLSFPVFFLFIIKTGNVFALHSYYIIPFVPIMCMVAAIGLCSLPKKAYVFILALITIESLANQQHDFFIKPSETFKLRLESDINAMVPKNKKIALAGSTGPQYLYFAHRKGWGLSPEQTMDTTYMNEVMEKGYEYLVVIKRELDTELPYPLISNQEHIKIYKMK